MKNSYFTINSISENINKLFLESTKNDLEVLEINDLNTIQCLLLYNIGDQKISVTDLVNKGYYKGTNVSYNLKKLIKQNYIDLSYSNFDKRLTYVELSQKGRITYDKFNKTLDRKNEEFLREFNGEKQPEVIYNILHKMENFLNKSTKHA